MPAKTPSVQPMGRVQSAGSSSMNRATRGTQGSSSKRSNSQGKKKKI